MLDDNHVMTADETNHKCYDIQFELGTDWKWRYRNINVSDT